MAQLIPERGNTGIKKLCLHHMRLITCWDLWDESVLEEVSNSNKTSHALKRHGICASQLVFYPSEYILNLTTKASSFLQILSYKSPYPSHKHFSKMFSLENRPAKPPLTFADLPTELRLQIWRAAFPGSRHVSLNMRCNRFHKYGEECTAQLPPNRSLPAILWVNQESRHETLRHYCLIYPSDLAQKFHSHLFCKDRPIFINPQIDSAYFQWEEHQVPPSCQWLWYLGTHRPHLLSTLRTLELRDISVLLWGCSRLKRIYKVEISQLEILVLTLFPNLESLCFTSKEDLNPIWTHNLLCHKSTQKAVNAWYERRMEKEDQIVGDEQQSEKVNLERRRASQSCVSGEKSLVPKIMCRVWAEVTEGPFNPYADEEEL